MKTLCLIAVSALLIPAFTASAADGSALYTKSCASCHGTDGKGQTVMGKKLKAKDYTDAKVQSELTDAAITKAIKEGVTEGGKLVMKPTKDLTDADVKALTEKIRSFKK